MAWIRVDDGFPEHRKVVEVGGDAGWLHICALAYCNRNLTDGHVPRNVIGRLSDRKAPMKLAGKLVEAGMWLVDPNDGWLIHDYLEYQPSREEIESRREAARERMAKARGSSRDVRANNQRSSHNPNPVPTRTQPQSLSSSRKLELVGPRSDDDDDRIDQAIELHARTVSTGRSTGYANTVRTNDRHEHGPALRSYLERWPDATSEELAVHVLGINTLDLFKLTGRDQPIPPRGAA